MVYLITLAGWLALFKKNMVIKNFLLGLLIFGLYKLDLTGEEFDKVYQQRDVACSDCPLRNGSFCSNKKSIKIINNEFLLTLHPTGVVKGCSCFLPFKKATKSKCPLGKWETFK